MMHLYCVAKISTDVANQLPLAQRSCASSVNTNSYTANIANHSYNLQQLVATLGICCPISFECEFSRWPILTYGVVKVLYLFLASHHTHSTKTDIGG